MVPYEYQQDQRPALVTNTAQLVVNLVFTVQIVVEKYSLKHYPQALTSSLAPLGFGHFGSSVPWARLSMGSPHRLSPQGSPRPGPLGSSSQARGSPGHVTTPCYDFCHLDQEAIGGEKNKRLYYLNSAYAWLDCVQNGILGAQVAGSISRNLFFPSSIIIIISRKTQNY